METIRIANPQPGGQSYTSTTRAQHFVRRGIAVVNDGMLHFLSDSPADIRARRLRVKQMREAAGMVFWNGAVADECAMKRPGEVRS
jgi:hypothetical protein